MQLIPEPLRARMLANDQNFPNDDDPIPVVKLITPDASAAWLLTEIDSDHQDRAFGLSDTGHGSPRLGYVSLSAIASIKDPRGRPVHRDHSFVPQFPLSVYLYAARRTGSITAAEALLNGAIH